MSIKVTLDQSKEWDLQVSELTQLADDAPTPDDFGDVQIQMICQRAAEWGYAQAAQPAQTPQNYVWVVYNKVASMYFWSEDAARKAATFTGSLGMDVSRIDLLDVAAQPAHTHAIDTSPGRVEKQAGNVQVPGWLPIESAPKDGTYIALSDGEICHGGYWGETIYSGEWWMSSKYVAAFSKIKPPTYWMPLPAAPSTKEGQP